MAKTTEINDDAASEADRIMLKGKAKGNGRGKTPEERLFSLDRPLSKEELDAIAGRGGGKAVKGLTVRPWFSVKVIEANGKRNIVPFVGICGTF